MAVEWAPYLLHRGLYGNPGSSLVLLASPNLDSFSLTALTARVAKEAARVFTMLPSTPQVEAVYLGDNGLLKGLADVQSGSLSEHVKANPWLLGASAAPSGTTNANTLLVDHTTLDPTAAKRVADDVHSQTNKSALMIDGPVSGGEWRPEAGGRWAPMTFGE